MDSWYCTGGSRIYCAETVGRVIAGEEKGRHLESRVGGWRRGASIHGVDGAGACADRRSGRPITTTEKTASLIEVCPNGQPPVRAEPSEWVW